MKVISVMPWQCTFLIHMTSQRYFYMNPRYNSISQKEKKCYAGAQ